MGTLYESILSLCEEKGIKGGRMCGDLNISKSLMTDLKSGRKKSINAETAQKIANYFQVSIDRVIGGPETEKVPAPEGGHSITFDDFTYAMSEETKDLPKEKKDMLLQMARFMKQEHEKRNQ